MPEPREIDVAHVARLARLNLTPDETQLFQDQIERVLEYARKLRETDDVVAGVSPAERNAKSSSVSPAETNADSAGETPAATLRNDEPRAWFTAPEALSNAPRAADDLFIVPKVVE